MATLLLLEACQNTHSSIGDASTAKTAYCLNPTLKATTDLHDLVLEPVKEYATLPGKVQYDANDLVVYKTLLEGVVDQVYFEVGDAVKKGQVVASVRSQTIAQWQTDLAQTKGKYSFLLEQKRAQEALLKDGLTTNVHYQEAVQAVEAAQQQIALLESQLALFRSANQGTFHIVAPKSGYIVQKGITAGHTITPDSEPLFSISNLKQVWVMVNIYANQLSFVQAGNDVKVRTVAYPDQVFEGRIDKVYNVFDEDEHVLKARVVLNNPDLSLLPGLAADIYLTKTVSNRQAFLVPKQAVVFHTNQHYVVVYDSDCVLRNVAVNVVSQTDSGLYIDGEIKPGQKVLASNALLVFEQLKP